MDACPCESGRPFSECCQPIVDRSRSASTAEELIRSRYAAFATGAIDWIMDSHHPETIDEIDRGEVERWSGTSDWLGLVIKDTKDGGPEDDGGEVTFRARYRMDGHTVDHVERAWFTRDDGEWRFHSVLAEEDGPQLVPVTASSSVGRNDPCPCGSGRKYKKCCGAVA